MKILRASIGSSPCYCVCREGFLTPLSGLGSLAQLIAEHSDPSNELEQLLDSAEPHPLEQAELLMPFDQDAKIICVGRNYAEHASEMGGKPGDIPVIFSKFGAALTGHRQPVRLPSISEQVDYEAELVVVIGKAARNVSPAQAKESIFGYTCGNDISARDWQKGKPGGQWLLGKTFETFAPVGPWIVTADEIGFSPSLNIELRLNGKTMQSSNTSKLIFGIDYLISHLSQFFTLNPGDLIFTGTPEGVGAARDPQVFLKPGDQLEVEIEKIGVLQNPVIEAC